MTHNRPLANHLEPLTNSLKITKDLDMSESKIINLQNITSSSDRKQAVNKFYVDDSLSKSISNVTRSITSLWNSHLQFDNTSLKLLRNINMNNSIITGLPALTNQSRSTQAVNKEYVDEIIRNLPVIIRFRRSERPTQTGVKYSYKVFCNVTTQITSDEQLFV